MASQAFLAERKAGATGSTVVAPIEGTRPLLVEVQALVAPTCYGVPQRTPTGFDTKRLQMLLAVLEKRAGVQTGLFDVFVNVAGGVRVDEPAVDLGMALAVVSSLRNRPVDPQWWRSGRWGSAARGVPGARWRNGSPRRGHSDSRESSSRAPPSVDGV